MSSNWQRVENVLSTMDSLVIQNSKFQELIRYNDAYVWVVFLKGSKLDYSNSSLTISKVEIEHHRIEVSP
jgi:hypothetical protein